VFVPEGSEDALVFEPSTTILHNDRLMIRPAESTLSDDEHDEDSENDDDDDDSIKKHYAFPDLDLVIRQCVKEYEAVFPKLNFSSPKVCLLSHVCFHELKRSSGCGMASSSFISPQMHLACRRLPAPKIL
jgi:hypothetical protein